MLDPDTLDGISLVDDSEHQQAVDAIAAGHADYPSFRHLFPDPPQRARALRPFLEATVRDAIPFNSVLAIRDGIQIGAAAAGLPPGAFPWNTRRKLRALPAFARKMRPAPRSSVLRSLRRSP